MVHILENWRGKEDYVIYGDIDSSVCNVILNDDGFLQKETVSPFRYFVQKMTGKAQLGAPLFADLLQVPDLWEIVMNYDKAEIWDEGIKKAEIEYAIPTDCHNVKTVRWMFEDGTIYRVDHYDKYGKLYFDELLDPEGTVNVRTYYADGKPAIYCQPKRDLYTLLENGKMTHILNSRYQFMKFFLEDAFPKEKVIVSEIMELAQRLTEAGMPCKLVNRFETVFPKNPCGKDAYILTHSDQVEQLENLIVNLPELHFHIAAVTAMSERLMNLKKYQNVSLYPGISEGKREELLHKCTYYLDINHYVEICDAVYEAYRHGLLILGFENTLHNAIYVLPQCIFSPMEADKLIEFMKQTYEDEALLLSFVALQSRQPWQNVVANGSKA